MPSRDTIQDFVALVKAGDFVGAMERHYSMDATAQENSSPPRIGLPALIANERGVLDRFLAVRGHAAAEPMIDGDQVVINWLFEFETPAGVLRLDELVHQVWEGERMKDERFYYDPAQLAKPID